MTTCSHAGAVTDVRPSARGCEACLKIGSPWAHLRLCRSCGHVGCCDQSPRRHATAHFHARQRLGLTAPRPYPSLAALGLCWIKQGSYWFAYDTSTAQITIAGVFHEAADIPNRI